MLDAGDDDEELVEGDEEARFVWFAMVTTLDVVGAVAVVDEEGDVRTEAGKLENYLINDFKNVQCFLVH